MKRLWHQSASKPPLVSIVFSEPRQSLFGHSNTLTALWQSKQPAILSLLKIVLQFTYSHSRISGLSCLGQIIIKWHFLGTKCIVMGIMDYLHTCGILLATTAGKIQLIKTTIKVVWVHSSLKKHKTKHTMLRGFWIDLWSSYTIHVSERIWHSIFCVEVLPRNSKLFKRWDKEKTSSASFNLFSGLIFTLLALRVDMLTFAN